MKPSATVFSDDAHPVAHGRDFDERDQDGAPGVVNHQRDDGGTLLAGGDALGSRIKTDQGWLEIVGHRQGCEESQA